MVRKIVFLLTTAFSFIWLEAIAADYVGKVIAVRGQVYATDVAGAKRSLQRHSEVYLKENIVTQENSMAQLKLQDDTIISLKPSTIYAVNEFKLDRKNPKNNHYVGELITGVLTSMSGQGKHSAHDNHLLKTPVVTIAIRGTLFESGFKTKKSYTACGTQGSKLCSCSKYNELRHKSDKTCCCDSAGKVLNETIGIGWVGVADGAVLVKGGQKVCDINARDFNNNACFIAASGELNPDGKFVVGPKTDVMVAPMSIVAMQASIAAVIKSPNNSGLSVTASSANAASQTILPPATPSVSSAVPTITLTPQLPQLPVDENLPPVPANPGRLPAGG